MQINDIQVITITDDFKVLVSESPLSVPNTILKEVDAVWRQSTEQPGSELFDGKILSATAVSSAALICSVIPYRFFYSQRYSKTIRETLQINLVAVSGIILHNGSLYFGRRSLSNTQYPGFLELVPSGSLDAGLVISEGAADFRQQLAFELTEEVCINAEYIADISPLLLIFDELERTWDICCRIMLLPEAQIDKQENILSQEYKEIFSVPLSDTTKFIKANTEHLVPTTKAILERLSTQPV